ncbi:hypothetical protein [Ideonella sp. A 288]|uniref:hypothetical protein n=1 Tax=Ideonella sp. A 288 TaxID=1962181 RepID=UPI0011847064|nr:hypothetical protein [Ideonella sp. A 288]
MNRTFLPNLARSASEKVSRILAVGLLWVTAGLAQAALMPFDAVVDGVSQIVEVVDPAGPVVRVQTLAFGTGSPGSLRYHSGDVIDLATGLGSGTNRFVTDDGDELFGRFTVQLVPGADPSLFDLFGEVVFDGGTGGFVGAVGTASFVATGQFVSASEARTHFEFTGRVFTVPEPGTAALGVVALALALRLRRRPPTSPGRAARSSPRAPRNRPGAPGSPSRHWARC